MKEIEITPEIKKQLLEQYSPKVFPIKSETDPKKEYLITLAANHMTCTCRDFIYRSKDSNGYAVQHYCKHMRVLAAKLLNKGA